MIEAIAMIIILAGIFSAAVLNLAAESRIRGTVMGIALGFAVVVGIIFYGYGYVWVYGRLTPTALFRALLAFCRMFGGVNDLGAITGMPLLTNAAGEAIEAGHALFWFGHFCAFYVMASAAISALGEKLLRRIRVTLLRRGPLLVIFGVNANSVAYGKHMTENKKRSVLFVDPDGNTAYESTIKSIGAVLDKSSDAIVPTKRFLNQINMGPGERKLELAALHTDGNKNYQYAASLLEVMSEAGVVPSQISLVASGSGEKFSRLQIKDNKGYGSVLAFDDYELTARLIMKEFPPCERITFDEKGRAKQDFHVIILGYGKMGRAMLSQLIRNAQFAGSKFRADVFDPDAQNGFLHEHELTKHYDIRFHFVNGKSDEFYAFLQENAGSVRCIVICTGDMDDCREIAQDLEGWYVFGRRMPMILQAARGAYSCLDESRQITECGNIFGSDVMDIETIDAMAMQINHMYCADSGNTAAQDWERCDYFGRMSSRASADFYPAMLRAANKTPEQVMDGEWPPDPETLENMAISEHLRWCAFHYAMGFAGMPPEVFEQRAKQYQEEKEKNGSSSIRIGKDMKNHLHACLIPWEELDELSEKENRVTGGSVDYKQMDRNNVLAIPDVLSAMKESAKRPLL